MTMGKRLGLVDFKCFFVCPILLGSIAKMAEASGLEVGKDCETSRIKSTKRSL